MSLTLTSELYNGLPSLYANAGDWVDCQLKFTSRFDYTSNEFEKVVYNDNGGDFTLTLPSSDAWENYGFAVGNTITLTSTWFYNSGVPPTFTAPQIWVRTITYISGNILHLSSALIAIPAGGVPPAEVANGREFPTDSITNRFTDLTIIKAASAEEIEFQFNLTQNGGSSLNSLLDGQVQRLTSSAIGSMALLATIPLTQLVNKSGGYIESATLTYDSIDGSNYRKYTLNYRILQWVVLQSGFTEPNFYNAADHVAPVANIQLYGQTGNPNTIQQITSDNTEADTGAYRENFNGGVNNNTLVSIDFLDHLGDPIDAMDYSNPSTFEAFFTAPGQSIPNSTFRIGLIFRPIDTSVYQNLPLSMANNLLLNAPAVDYAHSVVPDPTIHSGFANSAGAQLDLTNLEFFISGSSLRVRGKIIPNAAADTYFAAFPDGARKVTMWASIGNFLNDNSVNSERVNEPMFDQDIIDAPTLGVQIPDMVGTIMLDHAGNDTLGNISFESDLTTEDDVLYQSSFKLLDNLAYEGIRVKLEAFNSTTGDQFTLEDYEFDFSGVVNVAGQFQPNLSIPRNFLLPPTTDRNVVTLTRLPSADEPGKYGLQVCYGFMSRWQYWLEQANADNDFFDILEQYFDGKNKNWQRYSATADWSMRVGLFTMLDGVEDFDYHTFQIRPYEDEDATTVVTFTRISDGQVLTALEDDELFKIEAVITWNAQDYEVSNWGEMTVEDHEGVRIGLLSSVLPHGGDASNALEPFGASLGLDLVIATNTATFTGVIDTNKVNVDEVSITYRIHSQIDTDKITTDDIDKFTTDDVQKEIAL